MAGSSVQYSTRCEHQVVVVGRLLPAGDGGQHLSCYLREACCFSAAQVRDVLERLHMVCFTIRQLNPVPLSLQTNGYSHGLHRAFHTQSCGFWSERQGHRRQSGFSYL